VIIVDRKRVTSHGITFHPYNQDKTITILPKKLVDNDINGVAQEGYLSSGLSAILCVRWILSHSKSWSFSISANATVQQNVIPMEKAILCKHRDPNE
jgi:hypothetical protein